MRDLIWGPPLIVLILGTGLYLSVRLRGVQFRYLGAALRLLISPPQQGADGDISHFQALMTALAATIGIGNIAGVAIAVSVGGLGSLFWMVIAALIGMATIYTESYLAVRFRITDKRGEMAGGPMYTIRRGRGWKRLAALFAGAGAVAALTTGNMIQSNSIADVVGHVIPVGRLVIGLGIAGLVALVLFGGIRNIGRVAGVLVPIMAVLYLAGGVLILILRYNQIPAALSAIVTSAFNPQAALGGSAGITVMMALRMGVARGLLASEAGLGSAPIAAAAAKTDMPGRQALVSMTGAFLSVCIVCMVTGLVLAVTGVIGSTDADGTVIQGVPLTLAAFDSALSWGHYIVIFGAMLFGYSTILGWAYYGEKCSEYLFGEGFIPLYRILFTGVVIVGAVLDLEVVWSLADISNAFMAIPNLIGAIALAGVVARETKPYLKLVRSHAV